MIIKLFTERVINGKTSYSEVPNQLKEKVAMLLVEMGYKDLIK